MRTRPFHTRGIIPKITIVLTNHSVLTFILVVILLAFDFYYLKNIAGRRLVGLRWWNEVDPASGDTKWVFESADPESRRGGYNATDRRFFWLALYAQPALWVVLGVVSIIKIISFIEFTLLWLVLVGMYSAPQSWAYLPYLIEASSHCPHPHYHQYPRLLSLRQIQPSDKPGFERISFRRSREECRGWTDQPALAVIAA
jgi:Eukaryotic protein of unknown function (DUF846)